MNYLSGALRYVAGSDSDQRDGIPRLIDRIKTSALPQDRRTAVSALAESARRSPQQQGLVGELAIKLIYAVLEQDKDYDENLKATLDLLISICGTLDPPNSNDLPASLGDIPRGISEQHMMTLFEERTAQAASTNVDMFLGMPNALSLVLDLLEKTDFYLKFSAIELLTAMAANSRNTVQLAILEAPQGVSRVCDLLDDTNRLLRSNAVLLLSTLCEGSAEICKIVAYGGVLEKLFTIIESASADNRVLTAYAPDDDDEDPLEAAIIIQDVFFVVRNLVRGASTTKTFIRDTGCLPRLVNAVKRATVDSHMVSRPTGSSEKTEAPSASTGREIALERQARKNLIIAMQCIAGLVKDGDNEGKLIKNELTATNLFELLAGLAFAVQVIPDPATGGLPENVLQVRVTALKTLAMLTSGHDEFRSMFSSKPIAGNAGNEATCAQVAALHAMIGDPSSAVRAAAYSALRESFVVDAVLHLPSSNLLNVMTTTESSAAYGDRGPGLARGHVPASNFAVNSTIQFIAETLKATIVGWPGAADPAGVFYACSLLSWILARVQGAKERMLASYINGVALLPQVVRLLGKVEREKGPPEIRIALSSLVCTWLHESSPAVTAFLSSAMHLPMLVDILKGTGSRGDVAELHVRGLVAVLLGICLQSTDSAVDSVSEAGFVTGSGDSSVVIPRGTISDIIRNRIGLTVFTACLDDLRTSKAFNIEGKDTSLWVFAEKLGNLESRSGLLSLSGSLGHERWYDSSIVNVVNNVYRDVGARALDLLGDHPTVQVGSLNGTSTAVEMNGHVGGSDGSFSEHTTLLADSTRDEVLNSYKEFIRSQDESLNAARRQIDELSTALRETQLELDARINEAAMVRQSSSSEAYEGIVTQKEALEALIEEKNADFLALSNAYAALEEEHNNQGMSGESARTDAEMTDLRSQIAAMRESLNLEVSKNTDLTHRLTMLEGVVSTKDAELQAVCRERDSLRAEVQPDISEALHWKTQADVAQTEIASSRSMVQSLQSTKEILEARILDIERSRNEDAVRVRTLESHLNAAQMELEELRSARRRELQVARESSLAAAAAAQEEIALLKEQLVEAQQYQTRFEQTLNTAAAESNINSIELLQKDRRALQESFEQVKTELLDTRSALSIWQQRAETADEAKQREAKENERLSEISRNLSQEVQELTGKLDKQTELTSSVSLRISELEQQSAELDEMRRRAGEESRALNEELAARTEQTIRLSGQLYEAEEARSIAEEEMQRMSQTIGAQTAELEKRSEDATLLSRNEEQRDRTSELEARVDALQGELEAAREALADAKDRESLSQAQARDREDVAAKASSLQESLAKAQTHEAKLNAELEDLKERLLSLDEAENAKRLLTLQVVELQKSLSEVSGKPAGAADVAVKESELTKTVQHLQNEMVEKDVKFAELGSSLSAAMDRIDFVEREKSDFQKQVTETEAMLSIIQKEREELSACCEDLKKQLERRPPFSDLDSAMVEALHEKLTLSEQKRLEVSKELSSLVEACRLSEREMKKYREENETLQDRISSQYTEIDLLRKQWDELSLSQKVENVVSSLCIDAVLRAVTDADIEAVNVRKERDAAISRQAEDNKELEKMKSEITGLQIALKDHDAMTLKVSDQSEQLGQLSAQLSEMQTIVKERDQLAETLEAAEAQVKELTEEKEAIRKSITEREGQERSKVPEVSIDVREGSTAPATFSTSKTRVVELEGALRDAARTVSATNLELIAAQALLVELSADKTAMRTELAAAQEEIKQLNARRSMEGHFHPNEATLSEVSEQEQSLLNQAAEIFPSESIGETTERSLAAAHAEIENLQIIVQRSVAESEAASSLLTAITSKVQMLEGRLESMQVSLRESKANEQRLCDNLKEAQAAYSAEKEALSNDIRTIKSYASELERAADSQSEGFKEEFAALERSQIVEKETLQFRLREKEEYIQVMEGEFKSLKAQLNNMSANAIGFSKKVDVLAATNSKYATDIVALQAVVSSVNSNLHASETREKSLELFLNASREELRNKEDSFQIEKARLQEQWRKETEEFETEIDRSNEALEEAERRFRNSENALKGRITILENAVRSLEADLESSTHELHTTEGKLAENVSAKLMVTANLADMTKKFETTSASLAKERDDALASIQKITFEKDATAETLAETMATLEGTKADLNEEVEQRALLEGENHEYTVAIESLEATTKRLRSELTSKKRDVDSAQLKLTESKKTMDEQAAQLEVMRDQLFETENELKEVRTALAKLEDEADQLRNSLKQTVEAKDRLEQDNGDLKAWVADLERQATELQSAAEHFEEVEVNLREALDAQRDIAEQNMELVEEVKKEREALSSAEAQARAALREKGAAEAARESSQRRATELEERIRRIREEHLVKFSNSEDAIRSKAQRCAHLETELASAERKLAELASVSDSVFAAKAELNQRDEDIINLRGRAEVAEERVEKLEMKLQGYENEMSEMRESGTGDALKALEAEHNELLVYLADLELECTSLKEELGRE